MDATQVENLISMLQSPDKENHVLALSILEAQHVHSPVILMFCYKFGLTDSTFWRNHAPNALKALENAGKASPYARFSYQQILRLISIGKDVNELTLFCKEYGKMLTLECGMPDIVNNIEIKINLKNEPTK